MVRLIVVTQAGVHCLIRAHDAQGRRASADISGNARVPVLQLLCNTSGMLSYLYPYLFNSIMGCKANI